MSVSITKKCKTINVFSLYPYQKSIIESGMIENRDARIIDCIYDILIVYGRSSSYL